MYNLLCADANSLSSDEEFAFSDEDEEMISAAAVDHYESLVSTK